MLIHHLNDSKFLIRLPKDNFRNEHKWMETNDEIVSINLNRNRKQNFKDKKTKRKSIRTPTNRFQNNRNRINR